MTELREREWLTYAYSTSQLSPEEPYNNPFQKAKCRKDTRTHVHVLVHTGAGRERSLHFPDGMALSCRQVRRVVSPHVFFCDERDHATDCPNSFNLWLYHTHKHPLAYGSQMIKPNIHLTPLVGQTGKLHSSGGGGNPIPILHRKAKQRADESHLLFHTS